MYAVLTPGWRGRRSRLAFITPQPLLQVPEIAKGTSALVVRRSVHERGGKAYFSVMLMRLASSYTHSWLPSRHLAHRGLSLEQKDRLCRHRKHLEASV